MGPQYHETQGFPRDRAQLFELLARCAVALERIATQLEANANMAQAQADAREPMPVGVEVTDES